MDNSDPYVIAFKVIVHCLPINNYIIDVVSNIITYYCGQNNIITLPYSSIENIIDNSLKNYTLNY